MEDVEVLQTHDDCEELIKYYRARPWLSDVSIYEEDHGWSFSELTSFGDYNSLPIKFCPFCGRDLNKLGKIQKLLGQPRPEKLPKDDLLSEDEYRELKEQLSKALGVKSLFMWLHFHRGTTPDKFFNIASMLRECADAFEEAGKSGHSTPDGEYEI